jgi:hypothetical protein
MGTTNAYSATRARNIGGSALPAVADGLPATAPSTSCLQSQIGRVATWPDYERRRSWRPWDCPWVSACNRSRPL